MHDVSASVPKPAATVRTVWFPVKTMLAAVICVPAAFSVRLTLVAVAPETTDVP